MEPTRSHTPRLAISRILARAAKETEDECHSIPGADACEKPAQSSATTIAVLAVLGGICMLGFLGLLYFLHTRRVRLEKEEDFRDVEELDAYGMVDKPAAGLKKPPPTHTHDDHRRRNSVESLSPSLRKAMGIAVPK